MITTQDTLDILSLCAKYYVCTDEKDVDGFMACWADDQPIMFESPFGNFDNRDALRAFEDEHVNRGMAIGKRHVLSNPVIELGENANTAYVTSYMVVLDVDNIPSIIASGIYRRSKVVKTSKGWKFVHRKLDIDPGFMKLMQKAA
jgi:SnoaL-like domain